MNNFKKILAVLMAALLIITAAGCSRGPSWSYKTDITSYSEGVYIYSLFSAYDQAYSILQTNLGDKFDTTASILDLKTTFEEGGEEMVCEDWIIEQADIITRNLIAIDEKIEEYGITLDKTQVESARELAKEDWYLGPYYEYYVAAGYEAVSYQDTFEPYGISFESYFASTYLASVKQTALFNYLYSKGGVEEVPMDEIEAYFADNYTSYAYFTKNLYETAIDETTGQQVYHPYADSLVKDTENNLKKYAKLINSGTAYTEMMYQYMKEHDLTSDPSVKNIENLEYTSLGEEVLKALNKLDEGKSTYIRVGDGDTSAMYFIAKFDIDEEAESYLAADGNIDTILQNMKGEDFLDYLDTITAETKPDVNSDILEKYTPSMFEKDL